MAPFASVLIVVILFLQPRLAILTPLYIFLTILTLTLGILLAILKIEQGMACDWDVLAPYFYILALLAVLLFFNLTDASHVPLFSLILSLTLIHSLIWFRLNSTVEPNIRRIKSLLDTTSISQLGSYMISLNLSRYFDSQHDSLPQIELWGKYSEMYPLDPRAYRNRIASLKDLKVPDNKATLEIYEQWIQIDAQNALLRGEYASYCVDLGNKEFATAGLAQATALYRRAIELQPNSPAVLNNLGSVYAEQGKLDTAISYFRQAIQLDTNYADAYFNLGQAYDDQMESGRSLEAMKHAAALGSERAKDFLRLGRVPGGH